MTDWRILYKKYKLNVSTIATYKGTKYHLIANKIVTPQKKTRLATGVLYFGTLHPGTILIILSNSMPKLEKTFLLNK